MQTPTYVTRFWENDPNRASVKIKLTLPMESSNGSFGLLRELASREPAGRWLYGLVQLAKWILCFFFAMSATKEPVQP